MDALERYATLLKLVRGMNEANSWSGETHIQKSIFFLQEALDVELRYKFILYKHGPFSFPLRDDLIAMRADDFLALQVRHPEYGPSYVPGKRASLLDAFCSATKDLERRIEFAARRIAPRSVAELEPLATALYLKKRSPDAQEEALARQIHQLKPHITVERAREALRELSLLLEEAAMVS